MTCNCIQGEGVYSYTCPLHKEIRRLSDQAAIDKDFIIQYQAQVERLSAGNERQKRINATHLEEHQRLVAENEGLRDYLEGIAIGFEAMGGWDATVVGIRKKLERVLGRRTHE